MRKPGGRSQNDVRGCVNHNIYTSHGAKQSNAQRSKLIMDRLQSQASPPTPEQLKGRMRHARMTNVRWCTWLCHPCRHHCEFHGAYPEAIQVANATPVQGDTRNQDPEITASIPAASQMANGCPVLNTESPAAHSDIHGVVDTGQSQSLSLIHI